MCTNLFVFIQMYAAYDENEIGALDCDEIEGYVEHNSEFILQYADEFQKKQNEDVSIMREYYKKYSILILSCICRRKILQNLWLTE